jgi:uncharacterized phage protein (TIGR01671 family)
MRTIKFRGKRVDNGEWVYGNYYYDGVCNQHYIDQWKEKVLEPEHNYREVVHEWVDVIHETVGQYIEVNDNRGKEIFDADILRTDSGINQYVTYRKDMAAFVCRINEQSASCDISAFWNIVGNIHDNPELLNHAKD